MLQYPLEPPFTPGYMEENNLVFKLTFDSHLAYAQLSFNSASAAA
jgi:hypothetical protein